MKKSMTLITAFLVGSSMFAAGLSQLTLSISTQGPDYYADSTQVLVGETYLLIYVGQGSVFGGIKTDGTLVDPVNNKIVTQAVAVDGAKCGFKAIQYPADLYPAGGSWVIVLLDTRDAAGAVGGLVATTGATSAAGAASGESTSLNAIRVAGQTGGVPTLSSTTQATLPANTPTPAIASVQAQGETVNVRIKNLSDKVLYEVQSKADLASGAWQPAPGGTRVRATAQNVVLGEGGEDELPVDVQVPPNDKVRFFRVIVPGSM